MNHVSRLILLLLAGCVVSLACSSDDAADALTLDAAQERVEVRLPLLAEEFSQAVPSEETIYEHLETYLSSNPEFFGATFSVDPLETDTGQGVAPYVFRRDGSLARKDLATVEGYDYTQQDWYTQPRASGAPRWSAEYFDTGGGDINMITYSIPVFMSGAGGRFLGILTTDIATDDRPSGR